MHPQVTGHRGAKGYEPENTIRSFQRAIEMGVDRIECDVHLTLDEELVVAHDDDLEKITKIKSFIKEKTLAELKELDFGQGEKIPTLKETLDFVKGKAVLEIELKALGTSEKVVKLIEAEDMVGQVTVISFHHPWLYDIKKMNPKIETGVLINSYPLFPERLALDAMANAMHIKYLYVEERMVNVARENNLKLRTWTVNTEHEAIKLAEFGVDAIATDYPDVIISALKKA